MQTDAKVGILLVNLGTPRSPKPKDVFCYLNEFLTDGRVIDIPWAWRQLLVRGLIVPQRYRQSSATYQKVWTEQGSPLMIYGQSVERKLQSLLGDNYVVRLAMRYQAPSIDTVLSSMEQEGLGHLIILPLFPQYASATTGSVNQRVMECLKNWQLFPSLSFISTYATHPAFINAFAAIGQRYEPSNYDHILFSFHGLPRRHILKADRSGCCLTKEGCCNTLERRNHSCYRAQCHATARLIAEKLEIPLEKYSITFQSRLGKEPWTEPYTEDAVKALAKQGIKNLLVLAPAFTADCLETTYEIAEEYGHLFQSCGGHKLQLVESLNDSEPWLEGLQQLIMENVPMASTFNSPYSMLPA